MAPECDNITKAEGLQLRQKKSVIDEVKGLGKIEEDDINCFTKKGEMGLFLEPFKDLTYYRSETNGTVVGNALCVTSFYILGIQWPSTGQ